MDREEALKRLMGIEKDIREIRDHIAVPAVAMALKHMEVYCYLALDHLGQVEAVCPEAG